MDIKDSFVIVKNTKTKADQGCMMRTWKNLIRVGLIFFFFFSKVPSICEIILEIHVWLKLNKSQNTFSEKRNDDDDKKMKSSWSNSLFPFSCYSHDRECGGHLHSFYIHTCKLAICLYAFFFFIIPNFLNVYISYIFRYNNQILLTIFLCIF